MKAAANIKVKDNGLIVIAVVFFRADKITWRQDVAALHEKVVVSWNVDKGMDVTLISDWSFASLIQMFPSLLWNDK